MKDSTARYYKLSWRVMCQSKRVQSRMGMNPADILASKVPSKRERLLENSRVEWGWIGLVHQQHPLILSIPHTSRVFYPAHKPLPQHTHIWTVHGQYSYAPWVLIGTSIPAICLSFRLIMRAFQPIMSSNGPKWFEIKSLDIVRVQASFPPPVPLPFWWGWT